MSTTTTLSNVRKSIKDLPVTRRSKKLSNSFITTYTFGNATNSSAPQLAPPSARRLRANTAARDNDYTRLNQSADFHGKVRDLNNVTLK